MTSFEAGFIKYAKECGLPDYQIRHILKRALEHPEARTKSEESPDSEDMSHEDFDTLNEMIDLDKNDKQMEEFKARLNTQ